MTKETPFYFTKVECPICKTLNEFETVRMAAYTDEGRDTDFCPKNVKWRSPKYQRYNPLVFFAATCSNCHYTREFTQSFKEWKDDITFKTYRLKTVKERHLDHLAQADSIIKQFGEAIDTPRFPNESAICKLHLAIFDEALADHPSALDLGRFYLRIGWIYRDLAKGENASTQFLRGMMLDLDNQFATMRRASAELQQEMAAFARQVFQQGQTEDLPVDVTAAMEPFSERFDNEVIALGELQQQTDARLQELGRLVEEYKATVVGGDNGTLANFGGHNSFTDFLLNLRQRWDGVVVNESEALDKAVIYYEKAYKEGRDIAAGNQQIQASYLIAELSRRIGNYDKAREYFNSTIKHGQEFIYQNRQDQSRTVLARKILELAIQQGRDTQAAVKV